MATVPGTPDAPDLIPKELRPTQADLLIAAGMLHQQQMAQALDPVQKVFRDKMFGTHDVPNQADVDKMDLDHATTTDPDARTVPWRDKVIDIDKLSPKELKAIGPISEKDQQTKLAGDIVPFQRKPLDLTGKQKDLDEYKKMMTRDTLSRALGGTANVTPLKPEDK